MADDELESKSGGSFITDSDQQKQHKELIYTLKKEGRLTRNIGSNSLRSVKLEIGKFDGALSAMRSKLKEQTVAINDLLDVQKNVSELEESEIERQRKKDQLESVQKTVSGREEADRRDGIPSGEDPTPAPGAMSGFFRHIGPGLGGFLGAAFGSMTIAGVASRFGGLLLRAIPLVTLAPMIGDFIGDFASAGLENLGADPQVTEQMRESFNKAGRWGAYGAIFGPKGAAIGFFAGALSSFGKSLLERFGIGEDEDLSILGIDVNALAGSETMLAAIGGTLALLAPSLLKLTGKLLLGALTGPVGLAVLTGAALASSVVLVEQWMERRRTKYLQELEDATAEGLASIDKIESGDSPNIWRRIQLRFGSEAQTPGEELAAVIQDVERTGRVRDTDVMAGLGETTPRTLTEEQTTSVETIFRNILNVPEDVDLSTFDFSQVDLSNLSDRLLNDLRRASEIIGLDSLIKRLDEATEIVERTAEVQRRIDNLIMERQMIEEASATSSIPLSQSQLNRIEEINEKLQDIRGFKYGSEGFQDFGSGSLAMLHGIEAVVPRQTPAGEMLATAFDENFEPRFEVNAERMNPVLEQIATSAQTMTSNIVFAPTTNAPVTSIQQGGSTVSSVTQNSVTSFGGGDGGSGLGRFAN